MAGYYRYTAVLDACVLYPAPLRDLLMSLAVEGMYGARWTAQVHDEWVRNLIAKRPDLDKQKLLRTAALMNEAVEDALVENYQYLIPALDLPDPDDRHVLAAAIVGHADATQKSAQICGGLHRYARTARLAANLPHPTAGNRPHLTVYTSPVA
jgi:hypothetical protein